MAGPGSWLSLEVTHALGWALIHSLWQCLALAALAAVAMTFSRRPATRYVIATATLIAMLAAPALTFLVLMRPAVPVHILSANAAPGLFAVSPAMPTAMPVTVGNALQPVGHSRVIAFHEGGSYFSSAFFPSLALVPANILPWLVRAWLVGVMLFTLRLAGGFLLLEYKRPTQLKLPSQAVLALARELERQLGLERAIRYLECNWLQAPAVIGWLRPIILLPVVALTGLNEAQLRAVIAHELAHIRRLDPLVNLLQILAETVLFYHPAIWWLNARIRRERELACDEIAIGLTGNRVEYARALTLMAEWEKAPALLMAANRGPLSERIFHILGRKPFGLGRRMLVVSASLLFLVAAMGGANALFGIAAPLRANTGHAEAGIKAASLKVALASNRFAAPSVAPNVQAVSPEQERAHGAIGERGIAADHSEILANREAGKLVARRIQRLLVSAPDLAALIARQTPVALQSNFTPAAASGIPAATPVRATSPICAAPAITDQVDLEDVPGTNLKTVPVSINGAEKQFLLDLGTNPSEISQAAVVALGLPHANGPYGSGGGLTADIGSSGVAIFDVKGARSAEDYRPYVRAASFTVGDATGHDLPFVVAKDPEMGKSKPYDGLMTGGFFGRDDVEVDFAAGKLTYLTPTSCTDPDQIAYWAHGAVAAIPMTDASGKIQVEVSIQGHMIPAVIDTSSSHTVMRRDIAELILGLKAGTAEMRPDGNVSDGMGMAVYRHAIAQISFAGGVTAYNVPARIQAYSMVRDIHRTPILGSRAQFAADPTERIPALTLGMDVLGQLHLYVVRGTETLYVTSAGSPGAVMADLRADSGAGLY